MREDSRKLPGRPDSLNDIIKLLTGEETVVVVDRD
jgi:hypothetical protein